MLVCDDHIFIYFWSQDEKKEDDWQGDLVELLDSWGLCTLCCHFELGHKAWIPRSFGGTREGDGIHKYTRVVVAIGMKWRSWKMKHVTVVEDSVGLGWHYVYLKPFFSSCFSCCCRSYEKYWKVLLMELIIWYSTRVCDMFQMYTLIIIV